MTRKERRRPRSAHYGNKHQLPVQCAVVWHALSIEAGLQLNVERLTIPEHPGQPGRQTTGEATKEETQELAAEMQ
jgi:hypothetical protein